MCPFRRSLTTWSPSTHVWRLWRNSGDRRLHTLEIGERQLNDWRLHRLPDVLPFCPPGVPFNTPILSLAATSSLPITWSVQIEKKNTWFYCIVKRHMTSLILFIFLTLAFKFKFHVSCNVLCHTIWLIFITFVITYLILNFFLAMFDYVKVILIL